MTLRIYTTHNAAWQHYEQKKAVVLCSQSAADLTCCTLYMLFLQAIFSPSSELEEVWVRGARLSCVMMIMRPVGLLLQQIDSLALNPNVGLPVSSVSSFWISVTPLALTMSWKCVPFRRHRENVSDGHSHWSPLKHFRDFWLKTQLCLWKWRGGDLEGDVHNIWCLVLNKRCHWLVCSWCD